MSQVLPESWCSTNLGKLSSDISYGYTAKSSQLDIGPKMLRITDIQNNKVDWSNVPFCKIAADSIPKYLLDKGDLLFARTGATVGKSFLIRQKIPKSVYASYLIRVRCLPSANIDYLSYFFQGPDYWNQITDMSSGIGQPSVNGTKLKGLKLPLPPLAEQKVIADKLDELLAQVESTKARLDAIPTILKSFRQSVLAAAVSGKLTEEWRGDKKYKSILDIEVPTSWSVKPSAEVCSKVQSGSTPRNNPFDQNGTVPFLKVYNIVNQSVDFDYKPQYITEEIHSTKLQRSIALPNDVLMNIVGPPLGKIAILSEQYSQWNLNQAITFFRPEPKVLMYKFLYYVLCEGALIRKVMPDTKGSVGQINISLTQCRESLIPLPSIKEQTEIVRRVEELFTFADKVEAQVNAAQARVNNLTQSILAKAFRGELTADWRAANPDLISGENSAEALLKKIKAKREKLKPVKKHALKRQNRNKGQLLYNCLSVINSSRVWFCVIY